MSKDSLQQNTYMQEAFKENVLNKIFKNIVVYDKDNIPSVPGKVYYHTSRRDGDQTIVAFDGVNMLMVEDLLSTDEYMASVQGSIGTPAKNTIISVTDLSSNVLAAVMLLGHIRDFRTDWGHGVNAAVQWQASIGGTALFKSTLIKGIVSDVGANSYTSTNYVPTEVDAYTQYNRKYAARHETTVASGNGYKQIGDKGTVDVPTTMPASPTGVMLWNDVEAFVNAMYDNWESVRKEKLQFYLLTCHEHCHDKCHGNGRGRR